jgi:hypothetical protein
MIQYIYLTSKLTSRSIRRPVAIKDVYLIKIVTP